MDPKQAEAMHNVLQMLNTLALMEYALLLDKLGVRQPVVYNVAFIP